MNTGGTACRVASVVVSATYVTASQLTCVTPAGTAGATTFAVSLNGFHFTATQPFTYTGMRLWSQLTVLCFLFIMLFSLNFFRSVCSCCFASDFI